MPLITFLPSHNTIEVSPGTLLAEAARAAGVPISLPCGGKGVCGRCLVRLVSGTLQEESGLLAELSAEQLTLACRGRVGDSDLTVDLGAGLSHEQGQFSRFAEDLRAVEKALMPAGPSTPLVRQVNLLVAPANFGDGLSDLDRLRRAVCESLACSHFELPLDLLTLLPQTLREKEGKLTLSYRRQQDTVIAVALTAEERADFGLALDLGTTTVAAHVVNLQTGAILNSKTAYNAQIDCGLDIISRIHYARNEERRLELRTKVLETINSLIKDLTDEPGPKAADVVSVSLAGNTTMIHLLLGIIPEYIRLHPYTPAVFDAPVYTACELGFNLCAHAPVLIAPAVGSYVGGDITAGLLATRLCGALPESGTMLFIDIGTNGEIVLGNEDFLLGCACSAGPAFEGGGVRHGCRASLGAIERVELDEQSGQAMVATIGDAPAIGICGSGIISLISELFKKGFIDAAGHFTDKAPLIMDGGRKCFPLADGAKGQISISEADIDNLMRAKAAVFSACQTLLASVGLSFDDLERVYVAGGFGRYLDLANAATIGLLPRLFGENGEERVVFMGNTSLTGAYMTLVSEEHRRRLQELAGRITYIDLSAEAGYMEEYMASLFLPHTTLSFA